jgi:hypothetical protein
MSLLNSELKGLLCSPARLRTLDDQDLVAALRSGCNDALAVLFERHSPAVLRRIRAILRDNTAADEIVHEVFLDFYQRVKSPYVGRVEVVAAMRISANRGQSEAVAGSGIERTRTAGEGNHYQ